jgi:hypothetical protein
MKTVMKIFFLGVLTVLLSIAAMANEPAKKWEPAGGKNKSMIIYKADKKLVGGKVEILSNGNLVAEKVLQKRKLLIDFESMRVGSYVIRITKGNEVTEFTYEKK